MAMLLARTSGRAHQVRLEHAPNDALYANGPLHIQPMDCPQRSARSPCVRLGIGLLLVQAAAKQWGVGGLVPRERGAAFSERT
jgi:hypothetical protein